jgi:hypothetical protein
MEESHPRNAPSEMTPVGEIERAIAAGRKFERALKAASEVCDDHDRATMAADLREFQSRIAGICSNLDQHLAMGSAG